MRSVSVYDYVCDCVCIFDSILNCYYFFSCFVPSPVYFLQVSNSTQPSRPFYDNKKCAPLLFRDVLNVFLTPHWKNSATRRHRVTGWAIVCQTENAFRTEVATDENLHRWHAVNEFNVIHGTAQYARMELTGIRIFAATPQRLKIICVPRAS